MSEDDESTWEEEYAIKRALVSISKHWWQAGLEFLYREVIIHKVDNLAALERTLCAPDCRFGYLVKKLVVLCYVPFDEDSNAKTLTTTLQKIILSCPKLLDLRLFPTFHPKSVNDYWKDTRQSRLWLPGLKNQTLNVTRVDWGYSLKLNDLFVFLERCPLVESLKFYIRDVKPTGDHRELGDDLHRFSMRLPPDFPHLKELQITSAGDAELSTAISLIESCSMPGLQRLTYICEPALHGVHLLNPKSLFSTFGQSLRYLHLGPEWEPWLSPHHSLEQSVLDHCPALEHLVLWISSRQVPIHSISHKNLLWVDLWVSFDDYGPSERKALAPMLLSAERLPCLQVTRLFDQRLWGTFWRDSRAEEPARMADLPRLLSPAIPIGLKSYSFCGRKIKQLGKVISFVDGTIDAFADDNDESGSDFDITRYPEHDDTSDVSSSSGSEHSHGDFYSDDSSNDGSVCLSERVKPGNKTRMDRPPVSWEEWWLKHWAQLKDWEPDYEAARGSFFDVFRD